MSDARPRARGPASLKKLIITAAAVAIGIVLLIALFDWNVLRGPLARMASERAGREVRIEGPLRARLLSLRPRVEAGGLVIGNPDWLGEGSLARIGRITIELELRALLFGDLVFSRLELHEPQLHLVRDASGRANWRLGRERGRRPEDAGAPADLPAIRRFIVTNGRLTVVDEVRKLAVAGTVTANESLSRQDRLPFRLEASGEINREPFRIEVSGGPLLNVDPDAPYPFDARVAAGDTRATARGRIARPFNLGAVQADLSLTGGDLADLYYLTGLTLPNSPPYAISGHLRREDTRYHVRQIAGKLGDSDIAGEIVIDTAGERPIVVADLVSNSLDLGDLAASLGAPTDSAREQGGAETDDADEPAREDEPDDAERNVRRRLLPDAALRLERVRGMDAYARLHANAVQARRLPLREVTIDLRLEGGVLTIDPVSFTFPQGQLAGTLRVDARKDVPDIALDVRVRGVRLQDFFSRKGGGEPPLEGVLQGRARLKGHGRSVHDFASAAEGSMTLVLPTGQVREAFAELTGVNVARGLGLLLTGDRKQANIRCGVADFRVRDGALLPENIVVDTEDVLITGEGSIDLESEGVDLTIQGRPKELRLVRVRAPITIRGPLRKPQVGIAGGKAAAQTGVAAALGALIAPLVSVLAFVDPGLADDANCSALLSQVKGKSRS